MRIFVGGIPSSTTSEGLRSLFAQAGEVSASDVFIDKYTGESKGFGFVEMPDASQAAAAIAQFEGYPLDGRTLRVSEAKPREDPYSSRASSSGSNGSQANYGTNRGGNGGSYGANRGGGFAGNRGGGRRW